MDSITNFRVEERDIYYVGHDLVRPEYVLANRDGSLFCSDGRGYITRIDPDGTQSTVPRQPIDGAVPNGFALMPGGDFVVADFEGRRVLRIDRDGVVGTMFDSVCGEPLGKVNFVLADRGGRLWVTVTSRADDLFDAFTKTLNAGYVMLIENGRARIVADGLDMTNECRLDRAGQWLYVAETRARRIRRFPVQANGDLGVGETFGPEDLGGLPDGIAFDSAGNLWGTLAARECIFVITPDGDVGHPLDVGKPDAYKIFQDQVDSCTLASWDPIAQCASTVAPIMTSVAFGGVDLKTLFVGSLMGNRIAAFRVPIAGEPMTHW